MAIISIYTGKHNSEDAIENGEYPLFDRSTTIKRTNRYDYEGEYVIVPGEGQTFNPKYIDGKFGLHQRTYAVKSSRFLTKYLYYILLKHKKNFQKYAVGSTVLSLRGYSFKWINNIHAPSLEEQKKIIDIIEPKQPLFQKYPHLVNLRSFNKAEKTLKKLIDIIEPIEETIDKVLELKKHTMELKTQRVIKCIYDKNNRAVTMQDLFIFPSTSIQINSTMRKKDNGISYFRGTELTYSSSPIKIPKNIIEENLKINKKLTQCGDILVQKIRYFKMQRPNKQCLHNGSILNFRPKQEQNKDFLYLMVVSLAPMIQNKYYHEGTKMPQLNLKQLKKLKLNIPTIKEQEEIVKNLSIIDKLEETIIHLKKLKTQLLSFLI